MELPYEPGFHFWEFVQRNTDISIAALQSLILSHGLIAPIPNCSSQQCEHQKFYSLPRIKNLGINLYHNVSSSHISFLNDKVLHEAL